MLTESFDELMRVKLCQVGVSVANIKIISCRLQDPSNFCGKEPKKTRAFVRKISILLRQIMRPGDREYDNTSCTFPRTLPIVCLVTGCLPTSLEVWSGDHRAFLAGRAGDQSEQEQPGRPARHVKC